MCDLEKNSVLNNMHQFDMLKHAVRTILTMQRSTKQFNCEMNRNNSIKNVNFNEFSQNCDNAKNLKQQVTTHDSETAQQRRAAKMVHDNTELVNTQRKRLINLNRNQLNSQNHSEIHNRSSNKCLRSSKLGTLYVKIK